MSQSILKSTTPNNKIHMSLIIGNGGVTQRGRLPRSNQRLLACVLSGRILCLCFLGGDVGGVELVSMQSHLKTSIQHNL